MEECSCGYSYNFPLFRETDPLSIQTISCWCMSHVVLNDPTLHDLTPRFTSSIITWSWPRLIIVFFIIMTIRTLIPHPHVITTLQCNDLAEHLIWKQGKMQSHIHILLDIKYKSTLPPHTFFITLHCTPPPLRPPEHCRSLTGTSAV